ncbi:hypothetical protein [Micromonospora sp. NPDC049662]|uniref:hypothetical protein n=1 Tax=Micromonospora sp. NPDC049662 TaxID=3155397 RepID=UPI0034487308
MLRWHRTRPRLLERIRELTVTIGRRSEDRQLPTANLDHHAVKVLIVRVLQRRRQHTPVVRSSSLHQRQGTGPAPEDLDPAVIPDDAVPADESRHPRADCKPGLLPRQVHGPIKLVVGMPTPITAPGAVYGEELLTVGPQPPDMNPLVPHQASISTDLEGSAIGPNLPYRPSRPRSVVGCLDTGRIRDS